MLKPPCAQPENRRNNLAPASIQEPSGGELLATGSTDCGHRGMGLGKIWGADGAQHVPGDSGLEAAQRFHPLLWGTSRGSCLGRWTWEDPVPQSSAERAGKALKQAFGEEM